jgi:hypothetical protein
VPGAGAYRLGVRVRRLTHVGNPAPQTGPGTNEITLAPRHGAGGR